MTPPPAREGVSDATPGVTAWPHHPTTTTTDGLGFLGWQRLLLAPRFLASRNRFRGYSRAERMRLAGFAILALAFAGAVFAFFHRALSYFLSVPDFGPVLTYKLLGMIFVTFFAILLFSNVVTSLSTFFLASELERIVAAPVPTRNLFYARFTETLIDSSWMMLLFAAPAFLAYGVVHHTGPGFYLMTAATLPPFLLIPAAIGVMLTAILVNVFPARRTKDILLILAVFSVALLYMLFRMVRPERLVNPEGFADFTAFLNAMQTPESMFLPSTWATEILFPMLGLREGRPFFYYLVLVSTAAVAVIACESVVTRVFAQGWTKAQEGRQTRKVLQPVWERILAILTLPFHSATRVLVEKEIKTFFRDTSQWSQLILLGALIVVYVYNFSVLPLGGSPLVTFYFKNVIAFVNLALAAFVTASVAVRFAYPSISLEGKAFWAIKTAPVSAAQLWWAKFWTAFAPLVVLGEILVLATNSFLGVMPFMNWLAPATLLAMAFPIVGMALAVGITYPNFEAENAAKVASSAGGLVYMVLCMSFIAVVVMLEAWPVYVIFSGQFSDTPLDTTTWLGVACALAAVVILTATVFASSVRHGIRKLDELEI